MESQFIRTELLIGRQGMERLASARVAVFGVGGVGGYVAEALARSGIGMLDLADHDKVSLSNLNRQIHALHSTVGRYKVDVAKERILDINPDAEVNACKVFYMPKTAGQFDFTKYDYIVDAIDTVAGKIALAVQAQEAGTPLISSMGAGNKMDPAAFTVSDIYATSVCPLAKVMRRELKKRGVKKLKVVYSKEKPLVPLGTDISEGAKTDAMDIHEPGQAGCVPPNGGIRHRAAVGSNAFVPSAAGLIIAGEVVKDLLAAVV